MSLGKLAGVDVNDYESYDFNGYTDIDANAENASYIAWAIDNGITLGYGNGRFGSNDKITLNQALVMVARYVDNIGLPVNAIDTNAILVWAVNMVIFPVDAEIDLEKNATRSDIAVMLYAISTYLNVAN